MARHPIPSRGVKVYPEGIGWHLEAWASKKFGIKRPFRKAL
jgi:hypothetical protein